MSESDKVMFDAIDKAIIGLKGVLEQHSNDEVLEALLEKIDSTGESSKWTRHPVWFKDLYETLEELYNMGYQNGQNYINKLR